MASGKEVRFRDADGDGKRNRPLFHSAVAERVVGWLNLPKRKEAEAKTKAPIRPPAPYRPFPVEALPKPIRTFAV